MKLVLSLLALVFVNVSFAADSVSASETPNNTTVSAPYADEAYRGHRGYCEESVYCRERNVTISCTAQGAHPRCSSGHNWVRCQAGNQVSSNRC